MERRQSPRVYRNRRIAAVIALLLVVGAIWGIVAGVGAAVRAVRGDAPSASAPMQPTPAPAPSGTAKSSAKATAPASKKPAAKASGSAPAEYPVCYPEYLDVEMSTDKERYTGKEKPVLIMTITNISQETCVADVGTKQMAFNLSTGSSEVFSTEHCQVSPTSLLRKIEPGKSETARFTWERNATLPGCAAVDPNVPGQKITSGTYQLTGKLGDITTAPFSFDLAWEAEQK